MTKMELIALSNLTKKPQTLSSILVFIDILGRMILQKFFEAAR